MKQLIFATLFLGLAHLTFSQDILFTAKVKKEEVPAIVIESIEEDFPQETIIDYYGIPVDMVEDVWYLDVEKPINKQEYDGYAVHLTAKNGTITATYDRDGKLISERQVLKDVALPHPVQRAIGHNFPGWSVTGDKIMMTAHRGDQKIVHYKVMLKKDNEHFSTVLDASGNVIKGHEHAVHHKKDKMIK